MTDWRGYVGMDQAILLHKLLRHGDLSRDDARVICGWPVDVFDRAVSRALKSGWIKPARHPQNGKKTWLGVADERWLSFPC